MIKMELRWSVGHGDVKVKLRLSWGYGEVMVMVEHWSMGSYCLGVVKGKL